MKGHNFGTRPLGFGESCFYKLTKKAGQKDLDGKTGAIWSEGLFLGLSRDSNEFDLWSQSKKIVVRARSVQRKMERSCLEIDSKIEALKLIGIGMKESLIPECPKVST